MIVKIIEGALLVGFVLAYAALIMVGIVEPIFKIYSQWHANRQRQKHMELLKAMREAREKLPLR